MEFKNKRILLVCKETFSYPLYYLAHRWVKDNTIGAFFFSPVECCLSKCYLNDTTYYAFKEIQGVKMYDTRDISEKMTSLLDSKEIDINAVQDIEKNYTHYLNINAQIISTQLLTRHYHWRNYISQCSYEQQLNWLILNYKRVIEILDDFKPDVILDTDIAELGRCVLREVAYSRDIPYISLSYSRLESLLFCTYNLDIKYPFSLVAQYNERIMMSNEELKEEINYVENYRNRQSIMPEMYKGYITSQYKPISILNMLRGEWAILRYFFNQDFSGNNRRIKRSNKLLFPDTFEYLKFFWRYDLRKQLLLRKNRFFQNPVEGDKYVYMPLHLIPESSTFSMAPFYINELAIIEAVSKSLPAGWWLYVKEHQAMIGERGNEFYRRVNQLPNVKMVQLNYYNDPKPWIMNAMGVITISGTTAYEAALLGKHAIVFSDVPFLCIDGITRVRSYEDLPDVIKQFNAPLNNLRSCAAYLSTVKYLGKDIDLHYFHKYGDTIIRNKKPLSSQALQSLNNLEALFVYGFESYQKERELEMNSGKSSDY